MAKKTASQMTIISIVLVVLGVGLAFWGYQMSGSVSSQLTRTFTGSFTNKVMMLYIGGAVSVAVGVFLYFKK